MARRMSSTTPSMSRPLMLHITTILRCAFSRLMKFGATSSVMRATTLKGTFTPDYQKGASWAHPVVVNGKLYLREQDKLMCYQVGN